MKRLQLFTNKRAKIFALLSRLGLEELAGTLTSVEDQVTLIAIRNYLRLKRGEVWTEIEIELETEGVQPVEVREGIFLIFFLCDVFCNALIILACVI